jgi:hypothetical protein
MRKQKKYYEMKTAPFTSQLQLIIIGLQEDSQQQGKAKPANRLDGQRNSIYIPTIMKNLSLQQSIQASSVAHPAFYPMAT